MASKTGTIPPLEFFRKTDDLDLCFLPSVSDSELHGVVSSLEGVEMVVEDYFCFQISVDRHGHRKPILSINVLNDNGEKELKYLKLNFSNKEEDVYALPSKYYEMQITSSENMVLRHASANIEIEANINPLILVLATKISLGRKKDVVDVKNLARMLASSATPVDVNRIKEMLKEAKKEGKSKEGVWPRYNEFIKVLESRTRKEKISPPEQAKSRS